MSRSAEIAGRASARSSGAAPALAGQRPPLPLAVAYLDVIVLLVGTIPALALGAPALGLLIADGAWIVQRLLGEYDRRFIKRAAVPRKQLGLNLFEAFGRIWLMAGAIIAAGVIGGRADGLTAAVTIFAAYSVAFLVRVLSGPPNRAPRRSPQ